MMTFRWCLALMPVIAIQVSAVWSEEPAADVGWTKEVIWEGGACYTAIAADFTKDGIPDIIADTGEGTTRLFVGPDWKQQIKIDSQHPVCSDTISSYIISDACDIDGDGDIDYIAACFNPGVIVWYEQPDQPLKEKWERRVIENQLNGVHSVIHGDVDKEGRMDLLATSDQPMGRFPSSLVWLSPPDNVRSDQAWQRHVLADRNAPGISHYLGFGDVNGDGRPDVVTGAKGGPGVEPKSGEWFAWWESPTNPKLEWAKHLLPGTHLGATNILPGDINGDGRVDFLATRGHGKGVVWFEAPDWKVHTIDADIQEPHCLQVQDIDGDGDLDAVTCAFGSKICAWYENDETGQFSRHVIGTDQEAYDIRVADLDGDGDNDFLVAGRQSNNVVVYLNPKSKR
ncbi:MAG: FG-GAP repeat domain-containing protein [Planctomycetaceae bacterium]